MSPLSHPITAKTQLKKATIEMQPKKQAATLEGNRHMPPKRAVSLEGHELEVPHPKRKKIDQTWDSFKCSITNFLIEEHLVSKLAKAKLNTALYIPEAKGKLRTDAFDKRVEVKLKVCYVPTLPPPKKNNIFNDQDDLKVSTCEFVRNILLKHKLIIHLATEPLNANMAQKADKKWKWERMKRQVMDGKIRFQGAGVVQSCMCNHCDCKYENGHLIMWPSLTLNFDDFRSFTMQNPWTLKNITKESEPYIQRALKRLPPLSFTVGFALNVILDKDSEEKVNIWLRSCLKGMQPIVPCLSKSSYININKLN